MNTIVEEYYAEHGSVRDAIKTLRSNIQFASIDREIKTLTITSCLPSEGKSTMSTYLAIAMAETGKKTLLVECDCRKPKLRSRFKLKPQGSWYDYLMEENPNARVADYVLPTRQEGLFVLDCPSGMANVIEVIGSKRFASMIARAREEYDFVIFDTPPLGAFIEAALIAANTDGTALVMVAGKVDSVKELEVIEQLKKANARIIGCILTRVERTKSSYYNYYSHYYGDEEASGKKAE